MLVSPVDDIVASRLLVELIIGLIEIVVDAEFVILVIIMMGMTLVCGGVVAEVAG